MFLDNAFQVFLLIQDNFIQINAHRWPATICRVLPLIAVKLSLPLSFILAVFSASYVLIQYLIFLTIKKLSQNNSLCLIYLILISVPVVHGFYWNNSELILLLGLAFIFIALLDNSYFITAAVFSSVLVWTHPVSLIVISFLFLLLLLSKRMSDFRSWIVASAFYLNYAVKHFFFPNWYDTMKSEQFSYAWKQYSLLSNDWGLDILMEANYGVFGLLILCLSFLFINKSWLKIGAVLIYSIVYLIFLDVPGLNEQTQGFYNEINFYPLCFFFLITVYYSVEIRFAQNITSIAFPILAGVMIINTVSTVGFYSSRINWFQNAMQSHDRFICDYRNEKDNPLVLPWASAYESLVISSLQNESRSFLYTNEPERFDSLLVGNKMLAEFGTYPYDELDKRYFNLEEREYNYNCLD